MDENIYDAPSSPDSSIRKSVTGVPDWSDYDSDSSDDSELANYLNYLEHIYEEIFKSISEIDEFNLDILYNIVENSYDKNIDLTDDNIKDMINIMHTFYMTINLYKINIIEQKKFIFEIFEKINTINDIEKINIDEEIKYIESIYSHKENQYLQMTPNIKLVVK